MKISFVIQQLFWRRRNMNSCANVVQLHLLCWFNRWNFHIKCSDHVWPFYALYDGGSQKFEQGRYNHAITSPVNFVFIWVFAGWRDFLIRKEFSRVISPLLHLHAVGICCCPVYRHKEDTALYMQLLRLLLIITHTLLGSNYIWIHHIWGCVVYIAVASSSI